MDKKIRKTVIFCDTLLIYWRHKYDNNRREEEGEKQYKIEFLW